MFERITTHQLLINFLFKNESRETTIPQNVIRIITDKLRNISATSSAQNVHVTLSHKTSKTERFGRPDGIVNFVHSAINRVLGHNSYTA